MSAEVLLMADVPDLGMEGDVVIVADGYARNFLVPKRLAAPVTEIAKKRLEKIRLDREAAKQAEIDAAQQLAAKLEKVSCTMPVKVSDGEHMFGSVSSVDIAASLQEQGFEIDKDLIQLDLPIKELGVYDIAIKLHADVQASVKVWVVEE